MNMNRHGNVQQPDLEYVRQLFCDEARHMPQVPYQYSISPSFTIIRNQAIHTMLRHFVRSQENSCSLMASTLSLFDRYTSQVGSQHHDESFIINCVRLLSKYDRNPGPGNRTPFLQSLTDAERIILHQLGDSVSTITPLQFLDFFISLFNIPRPEYQRVKFILKRTAVSYYLPFIYLDISFTRFRPSTVAATALLSALDVVGSGHYPRFYQAILSRGCVSKRQLDRCLALLLQKRVWALVNAGTVLPLLNLPPTFCHCQCHCQCHATSS